MAKISLVLLILGAFIVLTSLIPPGENLPQTGPTFANYGEAWQGGKILLAFVNWTLVALVVAACQVMTSASGSGMTTNRCDRYYSNPPIVMSKITN